MRHRKGRAQLSVTSAAPSRVGDGEFRPTADERLERGVFLAPYLIAGLGVLIVVNARGDRIAELPLIAGTDEETAWVDLESWLDDVDPLPKKRDERPATPVRALRLVQ